MTDPEPLSGAKLAAGAGLAAVATAAGPFAGSLLPIGDWGSAIGAGFGSVVAGVVGWAASKGLHHGKAAWSRTGSHTVPRAASRSPQPSFPAVTGKRFTRRHRIAGAVVALSLAAAFAIIGGVETTAGPIHTLTTGQEAGSVFGGSPRGAESESPAPVTISPSLPSTGAPTTRSPSESASPGASSASPSPTAPQPTAPVPSIPASRPSQEMTP